MELLDQVEKIEQAEDYESLRRIGSSLLTACGLERFTYIELTPSVSPETEFFISTYDTAWVRYYIEQKYRDSDPVLVKARSQLSPFAWPDDCLPGKGSMNDRQFFGEAAAFGIRHGLGVPVHGPGGCLSMLNGTVHVQASKLPKHYRAHRKALQFVAISLKAKVDLLREGDITRVTLSQRQQECLLWTACGKTAWEIGEILSISERTVVFHLQCAKKKFGVYSKHMAVVKAIMHGLIHP